MRRAAVGTFFVLGLMSAGVTFAFSGLPGRGVLQTVTTDVSTVTTPADLWKLALSDILACELPSEPPVSDRNDVRLYRPSDRWAFRIWSVNIYDISNCMRVKPDLV